MDTLIFKPGRLAIMLGTAAFMVTMPVKFGFGTDDGLLLLKSAQALASSGSDDSGDDDDDSGHGGRGSDDNSDDDSNDDSNDDGDDDSDDDSSSTGGSAGGTTGGSGGGSGVTKVEVSSTGVEVTYADGTKEEIENGRYERKNAAGRTVEQRPATQADIDRLLAAN